MLSSARNVIKPTPPQPMMLRGIQHVVKCTKPHGHLRTVVQLLTNWYGPPSRHLAGSNVGGNSPPQQSFRNPWPLLQRVKLDRLGPMACFRLKVLWMTHHFEPFYITEAPLIAKLWRLEKMIADGMLLERASKHADSSWKLVVRPNEAAIVVNVMLHQGYYMLPIKIQCYFMSGKLAWEGVKPPECTWHDFAICVDL